MYIHRVLTPILAVMAALIWMPASAQNPFAPVLQVNEDIITGFEIEQRQRFLRVVSPANSGLQRAREELIEDRLRSQAVRQFGINVTEQDVIDGMDEFAARANLTREEFIRALGERGVAPETFQSFVSVGIAWRDLVRGLFGARIDVSEAEIDRALAAASSGSGVRVLLSEIIIPVEPGQEEAVQNLAEEIAQSTSIAQFSGFARQYSATATRERGGRLNWSSLTDLPPVLRPLILALAPGEITSPLPIPNAIALFQLRAIEETSAPTREFAAIEYAQYFIPGGRSASALAEANKIRLDVDVCDDLYGTAFGQPEEVLVRETKAPSDIPQDIAIELAKLDKNEVSTALVSNDGQSLVFLMMCGRTPVLDSEVSRDDIAVQLRAERLEQLADSYLEELRADARIREK